ncbi:MAG: C10 family peptidase [Muribaculaceae bacterium]|nr:C10 family peptidase [Muribaculaceae bacterium]
MKKLFFLASLLSVIAATAAPVSPEKAQQAAAQFLQQHRPNLTVQSKPVVSAPRMMNNGHLSTEQSNYYIFNTVGKKGFVIVSGDDRTTPILGYTDSGSLDPNNMPANMKAWLENYSKQISALDMLGITGEGYSAPRPTRNSISPLISTRWDQGDPYWIHAPEFMDIDENGDTISEYAYTGCVAVSMSQIMNYYKFPLACTKTIPSYEMTYYWNDDYYITNTDPLAPIYFDWDNMKDNYTGAETQAEKDAVAWLMFYAGSAARMNYGTSASSTSDPYIPTAFNEYFNYDAKLVYRSDYEQADWEELIYQELYAGRPVIYNGRSGTGGGHSFVCDGYAYGDYYHINWGWGGQGDGYFVLSVLNPYAGGGVASVTSAEGYNIDQTAIIGIVPGYSGQPEEVDHRLTVWNMYYQGSRTFDRSDDGSFKLTKRRYIKVTAEDHIDDGTKYLRGIALYDMDDNFIELIAQTYYGTNYNSVTDSWPENQSSVTYSFGKGLANGTYKIVPVSSVQASNVWMPMIESDRYYIEATINGSSITLADHPVVSLQSMNFEFTGGEKVGTAEQCHVTVKNNSADRFSGKLYLYVSGEQLDEYSQYTSVVEAEVPSGGTKVVTFNFTPQNAGTKSAYLSTYDSDWNPAITGTGSVNIAGSTVYPMNLSVDINALNADEDMVIYDSHIKFKVDVTNNNTEGEYNRYLLAPLFYVDENGHGTMVTYLSKNVVIPAGETQTFYFEFDNLAFGSTYALNIYGRNENEVTTNLVHPGESKYYTIDHGMVVWDGLGNRIGYKPYHGIRVPAEAAAVSLEGLDLTSLIPNDNPNTLYYVGSAAKFIPAGLEAKNVIQNNVAQRDIVLQHGHDFFAPYRFRANNISYERVLTNGRHAGQEGGWTTMVLPFAATDVTADGEAIEWMHSSTDAKGLWICNFNEEEDSSDDAHLLANYVGAALEANVPYFVAPYDGGTDGVDMRGKTYVFSAQNVVVKPNPTAITSGTYHMTVGEYASKMVEDAYFLNAEGSHFIQQAVGRVNAFEAYANNVRPNVGAHAQLQILLAEEGPVSLRGDVDGNGTVNILDITLLIDHVLNGTEVNEAGADCDLSGSVGINDVTTLIDYVLNQVWR